MIARHRLRTWAPWLMLVAGLVAVGLLAGDPTDDGRPLDPTSTGPLGTKALVDTLRELGADVSVGSEAPDPSATTALLFVDVLDEATRGEVASWVRAGGTLIVTDPGSPLSPASPARGAQVAFLDPELRQDCDVPALRDVRRIDVGGAILQEVPAGATGCFRLGGDDAWVVVAPVSEGTVVAIGGAGFLVNSALDQADNGVLAVSLLAPTAAERVVVLQPPTPGSGRSGLLDLIGRNVELAVMQLAVAFVVLVGWRARRLGRPVLEPQPVKLAGSELVVAVGELMQRARGRDQAAAVLRDDLHRWLAERVGLPASAPPDVVAEVVAARTPTVTAEEVLQPLAGGMPPGEDGLVALAHSVESIRQRVTGVAD